ncbi:MAG: ROK family protein [Pseudomonadota bacterium]
MLKFAAVEAGGTKFLCGVFDEQRNLLAETRIPTTHPAETLSKVAAFFQKQKCTFDSAGVASFGPLDLDSSSSDYGKIVSTPKSGWSNTDILAAVKAACKAPTAIDTDVNAAALAEVRFGNAQGLQDACYITVGTGIGVGIISGGKILPSVMHPEAGHIRVPRYPGDHFEGVCAYHGDCVEGLASGPAIEKRWGQPAERLPADHQAWDLEAHYIAHLCANLTYTIRPQRIVLGGGVFGQLRLYDKTRAVFSGLIAGYAPGPAGDPSTFLSEPGVIGSPGLLGAGELARDLRANTP